jgi:hypothetical protein
MGMIFRDLEKVNLKIDFLKPTTNYSKKKTLQKPRD